MNCKHFSVRNEFYYFEDGSLIVPPYSELYEPLLSYIRALELIAKKPLEVFGSSTLDLWANEDDERWDEL